MKNPLKKFLVLQSQRINLSRDQAGKLFSASAHSPYLTRHRMTHIIGRVQLVSVLFAVLVLGWSVVDYFAFQWPTWAILTASRFISAVVFIVLAMPAKLEKKPIIAFTMLSIMLAGPPVFYLLSLPLLNGVEFGPLGQIVAKLYSFLPYVMIAGLSLFPLTVIELIAFGLPALVLTAYGAAQIGIFNWPDYIGSIWLGGLLFGAAAIASLNQTRYMMTLVTQASLDPLTETYTRRSGSEIIDIQFRVAARQQSAFAIAFFDLDNFKSINDSFGHEEGDRILRQFIDHLRGYIRNSDTIVRWGGEEFVLVLPNTSETGIRLVLDRITAGWFGARPDGKPLTASIGISERNNDNKHDWPALVELADERMYKAKENGRACFVMA
jgi:diguanylate cyclase (GGDEF)-like protein